MTITHGMQPGSLSGRSGDQNAAAKRWLISERCSITAVTNSMMRTGRRWFSSANSPRTARALPLRSNSTGSRPVPEWFLTFRRFSFNYMRSRSMTPRKHLIPWLVTFRDLQRYLYRAIRACARGRVLFFYFRIKRGKVELFTLSPYHHDHHRVLANARAMFAAGQMKMVRLEDLPAIRGANGPK